MPMQLPLHAVRGVVPLGHSVVATLGAGEGVGCAVEESGTELDLLAHPCLHCALKAGGYGKAVWRMR